MSSGAIIWGLVAILISASALSLGLAFGLRVALWTYFTLWVSILIFAWWRTTQ